MSQMLENRDLERAFHVEGTAYAKEQMQKRGQHSHAQVLLLTKTALRQAPCCIPFQPECAPPVSLNGNSGNFTPCKIEHM